MIARYGLVGGLNTIVGLAIIAVLDQGMRVAPALANAAGYAVGIALGYGLNRGFVFRDHVNPAATGPRYLLIVTVGVVLNQLVLQVVLVSAPHGDWRHAAAQGAGAIVYTVAVFLGCRLWVFRPEGKTTRAEHQDYLQNP